MYSGRNVIALHSYQLSKTKSGFEMEQYTFVRDEVWNTKKMVKSTMAKFLRVENLPQITIAWNDC